MPNVVVWGGVLSNNQMCEVRMKIEFLMRKYFYIKLSFYIKLIYYKLDFILHDNKALYIVQKLNIVFWLTRVFFNLNISRLYCLKLIVV